MIDTFNEYAKFTNTTASYEGGMQYVALGLAGESGEFLNKLKKVLRGDYKLDDLHKKLLALELGDITWYAVRAAEEQGSKPSYFIENDINVYHKNFMGAEGMGTIFKNAASLNKIIADFTDVLYSAPRVNAMTFKNAFSSIMDLVALIAGQLQIDLLYIINENANKLTKRKSIDAIKGSGDIDRVADVFAEVGTNPAKKKIDITTEDDFEVEVDAAGLVVEKPKKNARHTKKKTKVR